MNSKDGNVTKQKVLIGYGALYLDRKETTRMTEREIATLRDTYKREGHVARGVAYDVITSGVKSITPRVEKITAEVEQIIHKAFADVPCTDDFQVVVAASIARNKQDDGPRPALEWAKRAQKDGIEAANEALAPEGAERVPTDLGHEIRHVRADEAD